MDVETLTQSILARSSNLAELKALAKHLKSSSSLLKDAVDELPGALEELDFTTHALGALYILYVPSLPCPRRTKTVAIAITIAIAIVIACLRTTRVQEKGVKLTLTRTTATLATMMSTVVGGRGKQCGLWPGAQGQCEPG